MSDLPDQPLYGTDSQGNAEAPPSPPPVPPVQPAAGYGDGSTPSPYGSPQYGYGTPQYGYPQNPYAQNPYVQNPYAPNPYAQNPYMVGYTYVSKPDAPFAVLSLVLGILGFVPIFPFMLFVSPFALIFGLIGRARVNDAPPGTYETGKLTAGWIMGLIGTILLVFIVALFVLVLVSSDTTPQSG